MEQRLFYALAADAVLVVHALIAAFVVFGLLATMMGAVAHWRWVRNPWFRTAHLLAIGVVVAQVWLDRVCPLTTWEMALRQRAGEVTYEGAFIAHWVGRLLFYQAPAWVFTITYTLFGAAVVWSWIQFPPRSFRRQKPPSR